MSKKKSPATPRGTRTGSSDPMDPALLSEIMRLMSENDLSGVELRSGDKRIVLRRGGEVIHTLPAHPPSAAPAPGVAPAPTPTGGGEQPPPQPSPLDSDAGLIPIKSPMVGTVYLKPAPDAKPYVSDGGQIGPDTVVCLIEAMKVFNEIKAETSGTVAKILVTDGQTVEFGQALFMVKP